MPIVSISNVEDLLVLCTWFLLVCRKGWSCYIFFSFFVQNLRFEDSEDAASNGKRGDQSLYQPPRDRFSKNIGNGPFTRGRGRGGRRGRGRSLRGGF